MKRVEECPAEETLLAWARGALDGGALDAVLAHVARCDACREAGSMLAASEPTGARAATPDEAPAHLGEVEHAPAKGPLPGESFGPFRIERVLGRGGMGVVLGARDTRLERDVALKLPGPSDAELGARLVAEARALASVSHPNLVAVHEVGDIEGRPYLVMDLVRGRDLRAWVALERPTWRATLALCAEAASGLDALHRAGFVHRDIKPDNLMVRDDGHVVVVDLGLAKRTPGLDTEPRSSRTKTGAVVGTPRYLAPERVAGEPATVRSDVYAYAATTLELLRASRGRVPPRVVRALGAGLDPDPDKRESSVGQLAKRTVAAARAPLRALAVAAAAVVIGGTALALASPPSHRGGALDEARTEPPAPPPAVSSSPPATTAAASVRVASPAASPPAANSDAPPPERSSVASERPIPPAVSSAEMPPAASASARSWVSGPAASALLAASSSSSSWVSVDPRPMPAPFSPEFMERLGRKPTTYAVGEAKLLKSVRCDPKSRALNLKANHNKFEVSPRGVDFGRVERRAVVTLVSEDESRTLAPLFIVKGQRGRYVFEGDDLESYLDAPVGAWVFVCPRGEDRRRAPDGWDGERVFASAAPIAKPPAWWTRSPRPTFLEGRPALVQRDILKFDIEPPEWVDGEGALMFAVDVPPEHALAEGPALVDGYMLQSDASSKGAALLASASKKKPIWVIAHFLRIEVLKERRVPVLLVEEALPNLFDPPP